MSELYIEDTTYTVNAAITSTGATSITVLGPSSGSLGTVPSSMTGNTFRIRIDNEIMIVTATNGTGLTWTVTRGAESTTAATHLANANVYIIFTGGAINQGHADYSPAGTAATIPAAGVAGRLYYPTDGNLIYRDTGSAWQAWGPLSPMIPPPTTGFTAINFPGSGAQQTSNTFANGYPEISSALWTGSGRQVSILGMTAPAAPYFVEGSILAAASSQSGVSSYGICLYNSTSGKVLSFAIKVGINGPYDAHALYVDYYTALSTYSASPFGPQPIDLQQVRYMKITSDGTNLKFYTGSDGHNYIMNISLAISSYFTPDTIGFYMDPQNNAGTIARLIHWNHT